MKRIAVLACLLVLTGCLSAPERRQPQVDLTPPEAWDAATDASGEVESAWWLSFEAPGLSELIDIAIERNSDLLAAAARLDRAAAEAKIAGADLEPSVGIGLSANRQRQNFIGFPFGAPGGGVPSTTSERFGVSLVSSWEVDLWGRIRAGARAAVAETQAADADLRGARLSVAAQTAKVWFAIAEARQQIALAEESVKSFRLSTEQVRSRYVSGIRPALDLRLALSNLAGAEALLQLRRRQLDGATRQLDVLLGRYPDGRILERHAVERLPETPGPIPGGLPAELVARRPDLVAAERRLAAADQRYLAARRALYPRLALTASGGTASDSLGDLLDGDFRVWNLVGNLTQPLFQGGRLRAGVERADASSREALAVYVGEVLGAYAEVESALAAEHYLAEQERHLAQAAEQLVAARRLATERYRSGVGIYLVVLESQSRALIAESELLAIRRQRLDNRIELHLALGGGFEDHVGKGSDS